MIRTYRVLIRPLDRLLTIEEGGLLIELLRKEGIHIENICGGQGECGKCRVILDKGSLLEEDHGKARLREWERDGGYRLACRTRVMGDCEITIPIESRIDQPQILLPDFILNSEPRPLVATYRVAIEENPFLPALGPSLRLLGYSGPRPSIPDPAYRSIKESTGPVTVTVSRSGGYPEIIKVAGCPPGEIYGVAIDLGTTTIAAVLLELGTGKILAGATTMNRQITYGEELVTRIGIARNPEGQNALSRAASESINIVIDELLAVTGLSPEDIDDLCLGGNTVMNHLFAGIDTGNLEIPDAVVPREPIILVAGDLSIHANPAAKIYCLPNVSRFVGGDVTGDIITAGIHRTGDLSLLIDLGTNGEIVLGNRDWLASVSCASGPAFEGGGCRSGMRAMRGAIQHVRIDQATGEAGIDVIGGVPPRGICGSGIIDTAAGLFTAGILDFAGKFVPGSHGIRNGPDGAEFVLVPAERTGGHQDIVVTQSDINYLMDSKAAVCGAISVLLKKYRISVDAIRDVYLAGAFGSYADVGNVVKFGIIPEFSKAKFHPIGNGSLNGAVYALLSEEARRDSELVARQMSYIDLLVETDFIEEYSSALYIPGKSDLFPSVGSSGKNHGGPPPENSNPPGGI